MSTKAPQGEPARRKPAWWRYTNASSIGIEMAVAIVLGWWSGRWVEANLTHWKPWTSTIGLLLGCGAAAMAIRRTAREYRADLKVEAAAHEAKQAARRAAQPDPAQREAADTPEPGKKAAPEPK